MYGAPIERVHATQWSRGFLWAEIVVVVMAVVAVSGPRILELSSMDRIFHLFCVIPVITKREAYGLFMLNMASGCCRMFKYLFRTRRRSRSGATWRAIASLMSAGVRAMAGAARL